MARNNGDGSPLYIQNDDSPSGHTVINRLSGNVGIGVGIPVSKLDIDGGRVSIRNSNEFMIAEDDDPQDTAKLSMDFNGGVVRIRSSVNGSNATIKPMGLYVGTTPVYYMKTNGNVGIGTTDPQSKLHIGGAGEGIILESPNGTKYKITVDDSGNLQTTAV